MKHYILFFFLCVGSYTFSQNQKKPRDIKEILSTTFEKVNEKTRTFEEITKEADAFFKQKHAGKSFKQLSSGRYRDGKFVKYQRWKRYWKYRLNDDGTIGTMLKAQRSNLKNAKSGSLKLATCSDSDFNVDWTSTNYNGNFGAQIDMGRVNAIGFHPTQANTFIVGAAFGGLWKTTDGGQNYTNLNDDLPHTSVGDIIIDKNNTNRIFVVLSDIVFYGPSGMGIYESTDGGQTFSPTSLTFTLPQNVRIYEMDVNPNNPAEFLVATSSGLYRTTNYFSSTNKIINSSVTSVKYNLNNNNAHAGGLQGEYFLSTNNGQSFSLNQDFGNGQVRIDVSNRNNSGYVAITNDNALNVSSNFGQSFTQYTMPESNSVVAFANNSDSNILMGNFHCFRTSNTGSTIQLTSDWLGNNNLPIVHVDQRNIYTNPLQSDFVYYCNDGGVFRYSVSNNNFTNLSAGLFITQYYDIAVSQTDAQVLGGGSQDNGNVTRNSNSVWQSYEPTADGMGQEIDFNNSGIRYYSIQNGGLRRWESGTGSVFISPLGQDQKGAWETPFKLDPNNSNRIIIGYKSVYSSTDRGNNWTNIGNNISTNNLEQIAIAKSNSNRIYASSFNVVYAKNSNNNSWQSFGTPVNQPISDLEVHPSNENTIYISYGGFTNNSKVYKSTDGGANWQNISFSLPNVPVLSLETYDDIPGAIFIGSYNGIYFLNDGATSWEKYGCLPNTSVNDIEIQYINGNKKIFVGTHGRGIFEAPIVITNNNNCNATITPYVNDGTNWLQQENLAVCAGTDIFLGMQNVGTSGVEIKYPDGTIDNTPDISTAWEFKRVQASDSGVYTISYDNGTCVAQQNINLTVTPDITPFVNDGANWLQQDNLTVCAGTDIFLGMQNIGTTGIEIKHPDGTIDDTPDISTAWEFKDVQLSDAGIYTVFYNDGACIGQREITLVINPDITIFVNDGTSWLMQDNLEVCEGTDILLGMQVVGTTGVEIKLPNGTIDDTPDRATAWEFNNVQKSSSGVYTITYNDGSCTGKRDITLKVNSCGLSTNDIDFSSLKIYPNPVNEILTISSSFSLLDFKVSLVDISGRLIANDVGELQSGKSISVDMSRFEDGVYFVLLNYLDRNSVFKMIIKE